MSKTKDVGGNAPVTGSGRGSGGVTGKGFKPGQSGNAGRALPPEVRKWLNDMTMPNLRKLAQLAEEAEEQGDIKAAASILLAVLKKQVPDLSSVEVTGAEGGPIQTQSIDATKLTKEQLIALRAMQEQSAK